MKKSAAGKRIRKHHYRPSLTKVTNFSHLPEELLLDVIQYLYLPELEVLSMVCRRLRDTCAETLRDEQEIARDSFRELRLNSNEYGYHDFLLRILTHEINPNYVKRFDCHRAWGSTPFNAQYETIDVAQYIGWTPENIQTIRVAIMRSPWLKDVESPDELIARMLNGEEDAVLALLIPLLKNLRFLLPPTRAPILQQTIVKIARLQIMAETDDPELWQRLPLRKLHTVSNSFDLGPPVTLNDMIHYISPPSVRRVYLRSGGTTQIPMHERRNLHKLDGKEIPRSRASLVLMPQSDTWRNVAELLADHFEGPCTFLQLYDEPIPDETEIHESWVYARLEENGVIPKDPLSYYWDHCIISGERDPVTKRLQEESRSVRFELRYRHFHHESVRYNFDMVQYEEQMRQAGLEPSPDWLRLVKWHNYLINPLTDTDTLELE